MRDYPDGVRSVVLDSVYPPEFNVYVERSANLDRALQEVFKECEESTRCSARYKDLGRSFEAVVARLKGSPVDVALDPEFDDHTVRVDDVGFVGALHGMLYSADSIRFIPELIDSANKGDFYSAAYQLDGSGSGSGLAYGMHLSVQCSGEFKLASEEEINAGVDAFPTLRAYVELDIGLTERACKSWPGDPEPGDDEPVASTIPVLVLAGQFDPTTPPSWGRAVAERMERSFFVEFPGQGHAVGTSDECPFEIADAFLAHPRTKPNTSCVAKMRAEFD
jgi:pimeloyl-ACP methyl ester carboxylesterase